jgi:hypothetical protein
MKTWLGFTVAAVVFALPSTGAAQDLRLSIANGRVTLVAQNVTVRQILDEWSRVGQTKVVGAERLTGQAVTLELNDVPEGRALDTLLRSASGYIAKPRGATPGASTYDRILIMPASRAPAVSAAPPPFTRTQPQVQMPNVVIDDDGEPTGTPILPPGAVAPGQQFPGQPPPAQQFQQFPGQPPVQQFPGPPTAQPGQQPVLTRPGMLPPPQGVPGNPYQPNPQQPGVRPPGVPGPGGGPGGEGN